MPDLVNINNIRNVDNKRVTNKISFQVGEIFQARIIDASNDQSEIVLKTADGWQFKANGKLPSDVVPEGLVRFRVVGYEEGKLKIVYIPTSTNSTATEEKSIENIFKMQNITLSKGDMEIFKSMLQHDIPLTKDNVAYIKNIIEFRDKIINDDGNEDSFIDKYIQSKGLDPSSVEAVKIKDTLKNFFQELKNSDLKDVLTLKENGLDVNTENLKSLKNIFKSDLSLYKELVGTKNFSEQNPTGGNNVNQVYNEDLYEVLGNLQPQMAEAVDELVVNVKNIAQEEIPDEIINAKVEVNSEDVLKSEKLEPIKTQENNKNIIMSETLINKEIPDGEKADQKTFHINENIVNKDPVINTKTNTLVSSKQIEKEIIDNLVANKLPITKDNVSLVKAIIDLKAGVLSDPQKEEMFINKYVEIKSNDIAMKNDSAELKSDPVVLKAVGAEVEVNEVEINETAIKETKVKETEVKDIEPKTVKLEENIKNNIKQVFEDMKKIPIKELVATISNESKSVENKEISNPLKNDLPILKDIIKDLIRDLDIKRTTDGLKSSQMASEIKNEISQKTDIMKAVISGIIDGDWSAVKNNMNDFKVFNSISNQYYYMDLPVNISDRKYECKLLIKDDRKAGKKIDSKNVRMIVSVKTTNMGKIDAYIKVHNRNMSVNLKCEEHWIKLFENEKNKLISILETMNYSVNYKVDKKQEEVTLVNTRDFFQDNTIGSINVMV